MAKNNELPMTLPKRFRFLLEKRGLSQMQVALRVGTSQSRLSTILHGKHKPTRDWVANAARRLGVSPAEIDPRYDPERLEI